MGIYFKGIETRNSQQIKADEEKLAQKRETEIKNIGELLRQTVTDTSINRVTNGIEISYPINMGFEGKEYQLYLIPGGLEERIFDYKFDRMTRTIKLISTVDDYAYVIKKYQITGEDVQQLKEKLESI